MKWKHLGALLAAIAVFSACDEETGSLGMDMLPSSDEMSAHTVSFDVMTESVLAKSVFAKSSTGYIGRFSDPDFGYYEAGFLTALASTENFSLPEVYKETDWDEEGNAIKATGAITGDSVTAVQLVVFYSNWFGDSLNACRMSAYELNTALDYDQRYTNLDPKQYYDESGLLGRVAYSAYDTTVPDSVRNATDSSGNSTYSPSIIFRLDPEEFGQKRILEPYRANPELFRGADALVKNNIFNGVYLTTDQGDGTILYADRVDLRLQFQFYYTNDSTGVKLKKADGTDSTYYGINTVFSSTKEVSQINHFANTEKLIAKAAEKDWTYLKSPAGIFTQATLPYDEIYEQLANDTLNAARLTFTNYRQEDKHDFSMSAPSQVLLVRKQDYIDFFENNDVPDNITSYVTTHNNTGTNQYTFRNIARLVTTCINEKRQAQQEAGSNWNEEQWMNEHPDWNKVLLIPVNVTYDTSSSSSSSQTARIIGIQHNLAPSYTRLQGGPEREGGEGTPLKNPLKLEVTYTHFYE